MTAGLGRVLPAGGGCTAARMEAGRPHSARTHAVRRFPGGCPGEGPAGWRDGRKRPARLPAVPCPCGGCPEAVRQNAAAGGCVLFVRRARCIGSAGRQRVSPALPFCQHPFRPAGLQAETGGAAAPGADAWRAGLAGMRQRRRVLPGRPRSSLPGRRTPSAVLCESRIPDAPVRHPDARQYRNAACSLPPGSLVARFNPSGVAQSPSAFAAGRRACSRR